MCAPYSIPYIIHWFTKFIEAISYGTLCSLNHVIWYIITSLHRWNDAGKKHSILMKVILYFNACLTLIIGIHQWDKKFNLSCHHIRNNLINNITECYSSAIFCKHMSTGNNSYQFWTHKIVRDKWQATEKLQNQVFILFNYHTYVSTIPGGNKIIVLYF